MRLRLVLVARDRVPCAVNPRHSVAWRLRGRRFARLVVQLASVALPPLAIFCCLTTAALNVLTVSERTRDKLHGAAEQALLWLGVVSFLSTLTLFILVLNFGLMQRLLGSWDVTYTFVTLLSFGLFTSIAVGSHTLMGNMYLLSGASLACWYGFNDALHPNGRRASMGPVIGFFLAGTTLAVSLMVGSGGLPDSALREPVYRWNLAGKYEVGLWPLELGTSMLVNNSIYAMIIIFEQVTKPGALLLIAGRLKLVPDESDDVLDEHLREIRGLVESGTVPSLTKDRSACAVAPQNPRAPPLTENASARHKLLILTHEARFDDIFEVNSHDSVGALLLGKRFMRIWVRTLRTLHLEPVIYVMFVGGLAMSMAYMSNEEVRRHISLHYIVPITIMGGSLTGLNVILLLNVRLLQLCVREPYVLFNLYLTASGFVAITYVFWGDWRAAVWFLAAMHAICFICFADAVDPSLHAASKRRNLAAFLTFGGVLACLLAVFFGAEGFEAPINGEDIVLLALPQDPDAGPDAGPPPAVQVNAFTFGVVKILIALIFSFGRVLVTLLRNPGELSIIAARLTIKQMDKAQLEELLANQLRATEASAAAVRRRRNTRLSFRQSEKQ